MLKPFDYADEGCVVGGQAVASRAMWSEAAATACRLSSGITRAEALAERLGTTLPDKAAARLDPAVNPPPRVSFEPPSFATLVAATPLDASLADALDADEIDATLARLHEAGALPRDETILDRGDWAIAGTAGLLAGAAHQAFVGLPINPLCRSDVETGPLSAWVRTGFARALPVKAIKRLERRHKVSFDAAHNNRLGQVVKGLYTFSHRFHSLGQDPCAAWIVGVSDVLRGSFTAVDLDGHLICQTTSSALAGENLFVDLIAAFKRVGGHLASDVATPMGLPAPLMPMAQFLQFKAFGDDRPTIAATAREMYLHGYDFRHFVSGSLAAAIVEVIVRGAWVARRLADGASLRDALPDAAVPRLRRQLILGHATACPVNARRIAVTHNPLTLNWGQWLALLGHVAPELIRDLRQPGRRAAAEDALLDAALRALVTM